MTASGIPASDRIVVALWRLGHDRAARQYAAHALARNDAARAVLHDLSERIERGAPPPAGGAEPALDFGLAIALVDRYRFHEALTLMRALELGGQDRRARRLAGLLEDALAPFPADADPSFSAALQLVGAGQAPSALRALEEVLRQTVSAPEWLTRRQRALAALCRGSWWEAPEPVEQVTRETVLARVRMRDLPGALEAAERARATELAAVLRRLVVETERLFSESSGIEEPSTTVPMEGHGLGEFNIRMGMLPEADTVYRKLLEADRHDERARAVLADVVALRRALGDHAESVPQREVSSVHWLSKTGPKRAAAWSAPSDETERRYPRIGERDEPDEPTDVLAAADEAELLLKLGKADQALAMYQLLAIRHPKKAVFQRRIAEIEALVAERAGPLAEAVTARHDMTALMGQATKTNPRIAVADLLELYPRIGEVEDDESTETTVDQLPRDED